MDIKSKIAVILLSFGTLFWFIRQPINRIGVSKPYISPPSQNQQLTVDELNSFLDLWARINHSRMKHYLSQVSLRSDSSYPPRLVTWLNLQNWDPDRFFYNEQRLRELIGYIKLQNNINSNVKLAQTSGANLDMVVKEQRKYLNAQKFNPEEIELVKNNLYQINEIFAGRAVPAKSK